MSQRNAVARSWAIFELLAGNIEGFANKEIADRLRESAVNVSRSLKELEELGLAAKRETGRWYLTQRPLKIMLDFVISCQNTQARMAETWRNVMGAPLRG